MNEIQIEQGGFRFRPTDSAAFAAATHGRTWVVDGVLAADEPAVIGGPKKSLKTSVAIDLAVSVGSGTRFLGTFPVRQAARVAVLSGESGPTTVQETALRICRSKGVDLAACDVLWQLDQLPQLSDPGDLRRLRDGLEEARVELLVVDPLYLCLLGGAAAAGASNLYVVGPLLRDVAAACRAAGATVVLLHHATKASARKERDEPLELEDLAFAGVGEYARQWLLVNRRAPYAPGSGRHDLTLSIGGSAGHSAVWRVEVAEGTPTPAGPGRTWAVTVSDPKAPSSTTATATTHPAAAASAPAPKPRKFIGGKPTKPDVS